MSDKHLETEIKRKINEAAKDAQNSYVDGVKAYQDKIETIKKAGKAIDWLVSLKKEDKK